MRIKVKAPNGKTISVNVKKSDTIEALKQKLHEKDAFTFLEGFQLVLGEQQLESNRRLSNYGIKEGVSVEKYMEQVMTGTPPSSLSLLV